MSIKLMTAIWDNGSGNITASETALLLKLADYAADNGTQVWPSLDTLTNKTKLSRRTVIRLLKDLEKKKYLLKRHRHKGAAQTSNEYRLNTPRLLREATVEIPPEIDIFEGFEGEELVVSPWHPPGVTMAPPGCHHGTPRVSPWHPIHQLTTIEPSNNNKDCQLPGVSIFPSPEPPEPQADYPYLENPYMDNPPLLNTDLTKTDLTKQQHARASTTLLNENEKASAEAFVVALKEGEMKKVSNGQFSYEYYDDEVTTSLGAIDVSNARANALIAKYGRERIKEALEMTKKNAKSNPAAYFNQALAHDWKPSKVISLKDNPDHASRASKMAVEEQKRSKEWDRGQKIKEALQSNPTKLKELMAAARRANRPVTASRLSQNNP